MWLSPGARRFRRFNVRTTWERRRLPQCHEDLSGGVCFNTPSLHHSITPIFSTHLARRRRSQMTVLNQVHNLKQTTVALLLLTSPALLMAQTNQTQSERWLLKADLAP